VDDNAPSGGFSSSDLAALGAVFDTVLHPIAAAAFGDESDIDANTVVLVLLTARVNALIGEPDCEEAFITGFFFGADLAPGFAQNYNNGEVFYGMVPDPAGTVTCDYSVTTVRNILPTTFMHEFQHMISFNQHVLVRGGENEVLWVNEGLSHLAEELAGLHYDSLGLNTEATRFLVGNLFNGFIYLSDPAGQPMVTEVPPGTLESRGAQWLFMRYLVDRFGAGTTQSLVLTTSLGANTITGATGANFQTLLGEWALALYVSDLPNFTPPAALTFSTWEFRTTYASLNQQLPQDFNRPFPLVPATGTGSDADVTGPLTSGSGHYLLVTQPANGAGFELTLRRSDGSALPQNGGGQFAVIRIR
jgi:hypothetical protein